MKKSPNTTDQWVNTQPDSVSEFHLGPGSAILNEDVVSFTEGWLRVEISYHSTTVDDFFGAGAVLSGWDEATGYYAILFFEDPLFDPPEWATLYLDVTGLVTGKKGMRGGLEFTGHTLPRPPFLAVSYSHGNFTTEAHPVVMKLQQDAKGAVITTYQHS